MVQNSCGPPEMTCLKLDLAAIGHALTCWPGMTGQSLKPNLQAHAVKFLSTQMSMANVRVGVGVLIFRGELLLVGKR